MPKPSDIISVVGALINDANQTVYTNAVCLPYFNLALDELQEVFELNDIPVTHESGTAIKVKAGINSIGFDTTPALPTDLIEIIQLWESTSGTNQWMPLEKKDFLPNYLQNNSTISQFLIWSWQQGRIQLIAANADIDLRMDYTASMFNTPIQLKDVNVNLPFTNVKTYLEYKTAALCALFVAENPTRAMALDSLTGTALSRALGIPVKGMQSIVTRRRPFRFAYKQSRSNL